MPTAPFDVRASFFVALKKEADVDFGPAMAWVKRRPEVAMALLGGGLGASGMAGLTRQWNKDDAHDAEKRPGYAKWLKEHPKSSATLAALIGAASGAMTANRVKRGSVDVDGLQIPLAHLLAYQQATGIPVHEVMADREKQAGFGTWIASKLVNSGSKGLSGWAGRKLTRQAMRSTAKAEAVFGKHSKDIQNLSVEAKRLEGLGTEGAGRLAKIQAQLAKRQGKVTKHLDRAERLGKLAPVGNAAHPSMDLARRSTTVRGFAMGTGPSAATTGGGGPKIEALRGWVRKNPLKAGAGGLAVGGVGADAADVDLIGGKKQEPQYA